jgi:hypothetical protein
MDGNVPEKNASSGACPMHDVVLTLIRPVNGEMAHPAVSSRIGAG